MPRGDTAIHVSHSPRATKRAAQALARKVLRNGAGIRAVAVALEGELGAGKTTFAQGFLRALGVRGRILSPTFIFVRRYALPRNRAGFRRAHHFDLYRVRSAAELRCIGFRRALRDSKNIVLIEWPERAGRAVPRGAIRVHLKHGANERERHVLVVR